MSQKPCGCGNKQTEPSDKATKPEIVPVPPELRERNRALRDEFELPDYLAEILVPIPEGAEPPHEEGE